nr:CD1871A family CXXC motif-containing protein [Mediterraneibacter agrestimuris]
MLLSFAFISIGIYRDETATVLTKSINICLECIGIG